METRPDERIVLLIDGVNLHATTRALGFDIEFGKLLELFAAEGRVVRACYYTALFEIDGHSPVRRLADWLEYNGYSVVTKHAREFTDANGRRRIKSGMDIEIAVDAMALANKVDRIVLFTGDGDLRRLVEAVQREGVRVSVVSTLRSASPAVADALRRQADEFIELAGLEPHIARPRRENHRSAPTPARPGGGPVSVDGGHQR